MEEKKSTYRGYTQAQNEATQKYQKENIERLYISVRKGEKDYYKNKAAACGMSLNEFVRLAMDEKIARDNL